MVHFSLPDFIVVGSSFSGIAAARVLLKRGFSVLMVDGGKDLSASQKQKIAKAQERIKQDSSLDYYKAYQDFAELNLDLTSSTNPKHVGNKAHFGSFYCHE